MSYLYKPFDRFLEDFTEQYAGRNKSSLSNKAEFQPRCEVTEDKNNYLLRFDLPGVSKDEIKIDLHENRISVSGERKEITRKDEENQHFSEIFYGSFNRSFTFPTQIDGEKILAEYENGILNIQIPKSEATRARQITIK